MNAAPAPGPQRHRVNLTAIHAAHSDVRLFVTPGDEVISQGTWAIVLSVTLLRAGHHQSSPIHDRKDAIRVATSHGDRWFWYPARTLTRQPVPRRQPLW